MLGRIFKALTAMRHGGAAPYWLGTIRRTRIDYAREVGDFLDASVVTAPVQWIQRAFGELTPRMVRGEREREEVHGHPLPRLLERPNPAYGAELLRAATLWEYLTDGNAYWLKVRNRLGLPVELWWLPRWTMKPKWPVDGSEFISHYEYSPNTATPIRLAVEDVLHFRHGVDPGNPRLGLSPLRGVIREIFMDIEASNFVASLLRNMGVPGLIISPEPGVQAAPEDVEATKAWVRQATTGDRRGETIVMGAATKMERMGLDPKDMDLSLARDVAEERVCACLGVQPAVAGFGAGLQTAKVGATMGELVKLSWRNGVLPVAASLAGEIDRALAPEFAGGAAFEFDSSHVLALQDDRKVKAEAEKIEAERWNTLVGRSIATVYDARRALGLDTDDSDRIYLRPFNLIETPAALPRRALPPPRRS